MAVGAEGVSTREDLACRLGAQDWIASAFALRASADAVVARAPKKKNV
jgi:hypothetical protein